MIVLGVCFSSKIEREICFFDSDPPHPANVTVEAQEVKVMKMSIWHRWSSGGKTEREIRIKWNQSFDSDLPYHANETHWSPKSGSDGNVRLAQTGYSFVL